MSGLVYQWQALYQAAAFETDDWKLHSKIQAAEAAIQKRLQSNELDHEEVNALTGAKDALRVLRDERLSDGNGGG